MLVYKDSDIKPDMSEVGTFKISGTPDNSRTRDGGTSRMMPIYLLTRFSSELTSTLARDLSEDHHGQTSRDF